MTWKSIRVIDVWRWKVNFMRYSYWADFFTTDMPLPTFVLRWLSLSRFSLQTVGSSSPTSMFQIHLAFTWCALICKYWSKCGSCNHLPVVSWKVLIQLSYRIYFHRNEGKKKRLDLPRKRQNMDARRTWRLLQSFQPAIRKYCGVGDLYTIGINSSVFCRLGVWFQSARMVGWGTVFQL